VTNLSLASAYLIQATQRLKRLPDYLEDQAFAVCVRESQEVVEFALKAMLRQAGVEPVHFHDVSSQLLDNRHLFSGFIQEQLPRLSNISKSLRKERELSFYGDLDFNPIESYSQTDASQAVEQARWVVETVNTTVSGLS